jgi:GNAT superfamily N-acetyltransferase
VGEVIRQQAVYYARHWHFERAFEAVARELGAFIERYDPTCDCLFWAERTGAFAGSLTIDGSDPILRDDQAHLRWFIVAEEARGRGVGRRLLEEAMPIWATLLAWPVLSASGPRCGASSPCA